MTSTAFLTIFAVLGFLLIRNIYARGSGLKGIEAISAYCKELIASGEYDFSAPYYDRMMLSYLRVVFLQPINFSKMGCIKKEYRELLEPYFE